MFNSLKIKLLSLRRRQVFHKKSLPILIVLAAVGFTLYGFVRLLSRAPRQGSSSSASTASSDSRVSVLGAKASASVNQDFTFPLKDSLGKKITDIQFTVESAELRDEIIIQGKRATAVQGRTFLIVSIKMTNSYSKALKINSRDYLRLTANGRTGELLAPDIHNDPVVIEPTSTKYTRIGFAVNDTDNKLVLLVGEIQGEKTSLPLDLK